jgi:hypothetical protein
MLLAAVMRQSKPEAAQSTLRVGKHFLEGINRRFCVDISNMISSLCCSDGSVVSSLSEISFPWETGVEARQGVYDDAARSDDQVVEGMEEAGILASIS